MNQPTTKQERWTGIAIRAWALIGVLILVGAAGWLLGMISSALMPFGIGLLIVLLLRRPVELLAKRMNRLVAVIVCYVAVFAVLAIALTFLIPPIYAQVAQFIGAVPRYAQQAFALWDATFVHPAKGSGVPVWVQTAVIALKDQIVAGAGTWSSAIASTAVSTGSSIASGIIGLVLAFLIGFYTLVDLPRLQQEIYLIAGERSREELTHAFKTITRVLGGWLRGTLIQSTIVAILFTIGLWLAGVPYALAIGVIGGLLNVVPYVGPALTALLAVGAGLFVSPWAALWGLIIVFAVQQFDSLFMAPRIMSEQVDLHPLLVILSLLVGATLFGVPGMVLSVPVAAVIKGLFVYWFEKRSERQIFSEDGVLFRASKEECAEDETDAQLESVASEDLDSGDAAAEAAEGSHR
jgi:predicted PurR-regulated permease PerM